MRCPARAPVVIFVCCRAPSLFLPSCFSIFDISISCHSLSVVSLRVPMGGAKRHFSLPVLGLKEIPSSAWWREARRLYFLVFFCCISTLNFSPHVSYFPTLLLHSSACFLSSSVSSPGSSSLPFSLSPQSYPAFKSRLPFSRNPSCRPLLSYSSTPRGCPSFPPVVQPRRNRLFSFGRVPAAFFSLHGSFFPIQSGRTGLVKLCAGDARSKYTRHTESGCTECGELACVTKTRSSACMRDYAIRPHFPQHSGVGERLWLPQTRRCTCSSIHVENLRLRSTLSRSNFLSSWPRRPSFVPPAVLTQRQPCENPVSRLSRYYVTAPPTFLNSSFSARSPQRVSSRFPVPDSCFCVRSSSAQRFSSLHSCSDQNDGHGTSHREQRPLKGQARFSPFSPLLPPNCFSEQKNENVCGFTRRGAAATQPEVTKHTGVPTGDMPFEATAEMQFEPKSTYVERREDGRAEGNKGGETGQTAEKAKEETKEQSPERSNAPDGGDGETCWQRYPEVKNRVQGFLRKLRYDAALATIVANYGPCSLPSSSSAPSPLPSTPSHASLSSCEFFSLSDGSLQSCASLADRRRQATAQLFNRVIQTCAFHATLPILVKTFCFFLPSPLVQDAVQELRESRQETRGSRTGEQSEREQGNLASSAVEDAKRARPENASGVVLRDGEGGTVKVAWQNEQGKQAQCSGKDHSFQFKDRKSETNGSRQPRPGKEPVTGAPEVTGGGNGGCRDSGVSRSEVYGHPTDEREKAIGRQVSACGRNPVFFRALVKAFDHFTRILDSDRWLLSPEYENLLAFWRRQREGAGDRTRGCAGSAKKDLATVHEQDFRKRPSPRVSSFQPISSWSLADSQQTERVGNNFLNGEIDEGLPALELSVDRANRRELATSLLKFLMEAPLSAAVPPPASSSSGIEESQIVEGASNDDLSRSSSAPVRPSSGDGLEEKGTKEKAQTDLLSLFPFLEDAAEVRAGQFGRELKKRRLRRCWELLDEAGRLCRLEVDVTETEKSTREEQVDDEEASGGDKVRKEGEAEREERDKRRGEVEKDKNTNAPSPSRENDRFAQPKQGKPNLTLPLAFRAFANDAETPKATPRHEALAAQRCVSSSGLGFQGDSRTHVLLLGAAIAAGQVEEARRQLKLIEEKAYFLEFPALSEENGEYCGASKWIQVFQPSFLRRLQAARLLPLDAPASSVVKEMPSVPASAEKPRELGGARDGGEDDLPSARESSEERNLKKRESKDERLLEVLFAAFLEATHQAERCPRDKHRHGAALFRIGKPDDKTATLGSSLLSTPSPCPAGASPSPLASSACAVPSSEFRHFSFSPTCRGSRVLCGGRNFVLHREKKKSSEGKETRRRRAGESGGQQMRQDDSGDASGKVERAGQQNRGVESGETETGGKKSKERAKKKLESLVVHAEVDCLSQLPPEATQGVAVCIVELDSPGLGYEASHPCPMCLQALQKRGVSHAFFTTPLGLRASAIRIDDRVATRPTPAPLAFVEEILAARKDNKKEDTMK